MTYDISDYSTDGAHLWPFDQTHNGHIEGTSEPIETPAEPVAPVDQPIHHTVHMKTHYID